MPFSRGPERSRPFDDILAEAHALAAAGYREVTLLGQNVNSYGHDLPPEARFGHIDAHRWAGRQLDAHGRPDLAELIRAIDALRTADGARAIERLRFVTSHPWDLSDRLIAALADCPSVCEHLHLPVQSGDDGVLRRMGRQYSIVHYRERLDRIREAVPGITISTDIIVGFCGETEAQFDATLDLLETVRYDQVFAAAYSPRPGTPATRLADDVPAEVKRRRLHTLLALSSEEPTRFVSVSAEHGTVEAVGNLLFTRGLVPFELATILLIVAVVGAIAIARTRPAKKLHTKKASPSRRMFHGPLVPRDDTGRPAGSQSALGKEAAE